MGNNKWKMALEGNKPDGTPYRGTFNSYYLAVCKKQKLVAQGYTLKIVEPKNRGGYLSEPVRYSKKEKAEISELRPRRRPRVYRSNFK